MASDPLDIKLNNVLYGSKGKYAEIVNLRWGYFGPASATLVDNSRYHDDKPIIVQNDLVEISRDNFSTLVWKGRVTKVVPNSIGAEGVTWHVKGLEHIINRWVTRWNGRNEYDYNHNFQQQLDSPGFMTGTLGSGTINKKSRWSNGEILIDILEHAFGINTPSRLTSGGGFANMPITSDIPFHHVSQYSVTNPYAHLYPLGAARDYVDQLIWDAAEIKSLMAVYTPNITFNNTHLWEAIHRIVEMSGNHGVFIDVTQITKPVLVIHKFSTSTSVSIRAAQPGEHVETPDIRVLSDTWEFDTDNVRNLIRIEGRKKINVTDPTLPANDPRSGKLIQMDLSRKVWRVQNQDLIPFVMGWDRTNINQDFRNLPVTSQANYGPVLYQGTTPYTTNTMIWFLESGIMISPVALSSTSDWRVVTMYNDLFVISVGPGAGQCAQRPTSGLGSVPLYPVPGPFDAYNQYGLVQELSKTMEEFIHPSRQTTQAWNGIMTKPEVTTSRNNGVFQQSLMTSKGLGQLGYPTIADEPSIRDDTPYMIIWAEEIQKQLRDERLKLTLTIDRITLSDIFTLAGSVEPGLRKVVSLAGLRNNRWSDANLQVMSIECNIPKDSMTLELTSDTYNVDVRPPAMWERIEQLKQMEYVTKQVKRTDIGGLTAMVRGGAGELQVDKGSSKIEPFPSKRAGMIVTGDDMLPPQ